MKNWKTMIFATLILAIALAACGGGGGGASTTIKSDMADFKYNPPDYSVPAGEQITLELSNSGAVEHEWAIQSTPATAPFDEADKGNQLVSYILGPGESSTFTFTAPSEAGEYQIVCGIPGHLEAGMVGTLTVE
jgi:uncharacterized cupredoxin-like copper-binding protein